MYVENQYARLSDNKIVSRQQLQRSNPGVVMKRADVPLSDADLVKLNAARFVEGSGDKETGYVFHNGTDLEREYRSFTSAEVINSAKMTRNSGRYLPIAVDVSAGLGKVFDVDEEARVNIQGAIDEFTALDAALRGDGTLDWTLNDNSIIKVTLADLKTVKTALTLRAASLHATYSAVKAANQV